MRHRLSVAQGFGEVQGRLGIVRFFDIAPPKLTFRSGLPNIVGLHAFRLDRDAWRAVRRATTSVNPKSTRPKLARPERQFVAFLAENPTGLKGEHGVSPLDEK